MSSPRTLVLSISGMSCNHCIMHVKKALTSLPRVKVEDVQVGKASIMIDDSVSQEALAQAIEDAGYHLDSLK